MPLPDERPRQSVANLIGRFEQQGKRQTSPAVPVLPRSSSVSSQLTGDAAKEEVKEKREWPPKPVPSVDIKTAAPTLSSPPSLGTSRPVVVSPQPALEPAPPVNIPTMPTPASPEPVKSPPSKGKATAGGRLTPTVGSRRAVASPGKSRSANTNNISTKSSASSPPKTSLQSSVSQPLKSQHTGQSVASNPSTTRQARPVSRTAPSTPSRPKSSSTQNQIRPRTPSSGLFAPTAASLARSRNAPPPPPPPVKKVTLSSDAAERLSKPTAASLSKARTQVPPVLSPPRVAKTTSAGVRSSTPRASSKTRVKHAPVKPKEASTKEGVTSGPTSVSPEPSRDSDYLLADHVENGHESGATVFSDADPAEGAHDHPEVDSGAKHASIADEDVHSDPGPPPEQHGGGRPADEGARNHELVAEKLPDEVVHEHEPAHWEVHEEPVPKPAELHLDELTGSGDGLNVEPIASGNDIEDIVNLLEGVSVSKPRPQSIVSIPDEEVPNEY